MHRTIKKNIQKCFIADADDLFINKEDLLENPVSRADLLVDQEQTNGNVNHNLTLFSHNLTSESRAIYMCEYKSHEIENNEIPKANASNEIENIETNAYQVTETTDDDFFAMKEFMSNNSDDQIPEADASNKYSPNILNHPLNNFW